MDPIFSWELSGRVPRRGYATARLSTTEFRCRWITSAVTSILVPSARHLPRRRPPASAAPGTRARPIGTARFAGSRLSLLFTHERAARCSFPSRLGAHARTKSARVPLSTRTRYGISVAISYDVRELEISGRNVRFVLFFLSLSSQIRRRCRVAARRDSPGGGGESGIFPGARANSLLRGGIIGGFS